MKEINKYFDYIKKEYKKKKERKSDIDKLIVDAKNLIETLMNNINFVNEEKLRNIFRKINGIDTEEKILEFNNIKKISMFFKDTRFSNQPQVIAAKKWIEDTNKILLSYLNALEVMVSNERLNNLDEYKQQIELVERISRQEKVSVEELKEFYNWLMKENENQLEVNEIIIEVFSYLSKMLNERLKSSKEDEISEIVEDTNEKDSMVDNLTEEELAKLEEYRKKISVILKLAEINQLTIPKINNLVECLESNIELSKEFVDDVKRLIGLDLTLENVKLLDKFNDFLELNDGNKFEIFGTEIREILKKIDDMFQSVEELERDDENQGLLNILNNPQSLVVFLTNEEDTQMISYVEEDYEREIKKRDKRKAKTAVKKIITHFYTGNNEVRSDGDEKKFFGDTKMRVLHDLPERDMRCFYGVLPASEEVKKYLCETYNVSIDDMKNFRVYLYAGFGHIGNHETNYAADYYNRCDLPLNVIQVKRLIRLFSKNELANDDKMEIDNLINCGIEISKKLNNIERKKVYE